MKYITHSGKFHADEVCAIALHRLLKGEDEFEIHRTRDIDWIEKTKAEEPWSVVVDVAGRYQPDEGWLDHHQVSYTGNKSSAGMMLDYIEKSGSFHKDFPDHLRKELIDEVDLIDTDPNYKPSTGSTLSQVIHLFNLVDINSKEQDEQFEMAVIFCSNLFRAMLDKFTKAQKDLSIMKEQLDMCAEGEKNHLILPYYMDWLEQVVHYNSLAIQPIERVIWEDNRQWRVQIPPKSLKTRDLVTPPLDSSRVDDKDLVFVHKTGFIGGTWSLESALNL